MLSYRLHFIVSAAALILFGVGVWKLATDSVPGGLILLVTGLVGLVVSTRVAYLRSHHRDTGRGDAAFASLVFLGLGVAALVGLAFGQHDGWGWIILGLIPALVCTLIGVLALIQVARQRNEDTRAT
jgi:hypothetical protein